ncbi:GntR family transcriptional regulator [Gracilinema caldarium]|uniref:Transcriptional regulator, GntR family n=1 Tax=Gracilinema caldarium (strain ATCC 51460 / DSM 7334 / H1) TaxID=744872 RepID=F8F1B9_GRAC1|nr:GntR family transcriptional regulator [Gracilinema caldarium]AEJ18763.1 transcriptional regulator, GntR family [Gracilinema caldarium DSM 7334]
MMKTMVKNTGLSISENVYHTLRKNIVNLTFKPGQVLNLREITEKLEVSRTPVREALIRLEREGLIDIIPQVGTSISRIDLQRVEEEQFIRTSLEEKALALCLEKDQKFLLIELEKALLHQETCLKEPDALAFLDWDDEFHRSIFHFANKNLSWNLIENNSSHYRRIRIMTLWNKDLRISVFEQHQEIFNFLKKGDKSLVFSLIHDHFSRLSKQEQELLDAYPNYFRKPVHTEDPLITNYIQRR